MATASVEILSGPDKGHSVTFNGNKMTFGRHATCDIKLEGKKISRQHATIGLRKGKFVMTDMGSKNRTRINGQPITEQFLTSGDEIQIGDYKMRFRLEGADDDATIEDDLPASSDFDDEDDGTQIVDMNALLKGSTPNLAVKVTTSSDLSEEPVDSTDVIDVRKMLAKTSSTSGSTKKSSAAAPTGPRTPQNVSFARTAEGGNIEEGTDILNMEDIIQEGDVPQVREMNPMFMALGGGGIVVVILLVMIVFAIFGETNVQVQEQTLTVGQNYILSLPVNPANPIASIGGVPDELLLTVENDGGTQGLPFMTTNDRRTGQVYYHFACEPQFKGQTSLILVFNNGDQLRIQFTINEPKRNATYDGMTSEQLMVEVAKALKVADEFWAARENSDENLRNSYLKAEEALLMLSRVEFSNLTPEYTIAKEKMDRAKREINGRYVEMESDFKLAEKRKDDTGAKEVLRRMLELRIGDNDLNYLKNKTILEYKYGASTR